MMGYNELHLKHFESGLKIRAICDDLEYPSEYAQIFLYIHIRGAEHYKNKKTIKTMLKMIEEYYKPENEIKMNPSVIPLDSEVKSLYSKTVNNKDLEQTGGKLFKTEDNNGFFSKQISNIIRFYKDTYFRKKMVKIYEKNIKKLIKSYNKEKVEKAFERVRLLKELNFN